MIKHRQESVGFIEDYFRCTGPAEWVGQSGHDPVLFEIRTIFTSIQQTKRIKIRQKFTKLMTKYAFSIFKLTQKY